ncbi:MAG: EAL domain-containing protein [Rubrivivax sp.]|nr:EAL domain-containing protein [Rubrivivax sp.]
MIRLHPLLNRLVSRLSAYRADETLARRFRARQLQAVLRVTPLAMVANLLNVVLVVWAFRADGPWRFLLPWAALVCALALRGIYGWWRTHRLPPRETASPRALRRAAMAGALLAAFWGALPLALFTGGTSEQQLLVATVTTGMICAGGFALATVPWAGTVYVVVLGGSGAAALFLSGLGVAATLGGLLLVYCLIVIGSVWSTARLFGARLLAEAEAERQNEVIGLLLRDFEENASDLLWEVGADGRLRHLSPRLAAAFGTEVLEGVTAQQLLQRLTPPSDEAQAQLAQLREQMQLGAAFRDLPLATSRGGRTRWWSLSAKPVLDEQGRVCGWRGVASDITAARQANRQLTWLAHNDALTGLANRYQFRRELALRLRPDSTEPLALLCLDLDHFKQVNDTLGHAVGDELLRTVGDRLRAVTRPSDVVARLGGDEFALLTSLAGPGALQQLAQRLLDALAAPCEIKGLQLTVRGSLGIARAPQDGAEVDGLLNAADLALYAAKSAGRNEYRFYAPAMAASTRRRLAVEQALRDALVQHELSLAFQPQATLDGWLIVGFEALVRWSHPELGDVLPAEFIPVAEEAGLMPAIGDWVLAEACRQAAAWAGELTVSVNVSPVQAMAPDFVDRVLRHAQAAGLPAARLELEITESVLLQESAATGEALHRLRAAGVRIALDDFGTGYSALSYLRRFPFDTLKIDRSFVRELVTRGDARAIVRMIIGLARTLNMRTVAEGVEEPAHVGVLQRYGCELMQGYLVSRPLPGPEVVDFLWHWRHRRRPVMTAAQAEVPGTDTMPLNG